MTNLRLTTYDNAKDLKANKPMDLSYTELSAYERLASSLIAKKLHQCTWIKSIRYTNYYSRKEIKITHSNGVIDLYTYDNQEVK